MAGRLIRTALRSSLNQVRYVVPTHPRDATGLTAEVYRQVERDFGMLAPPISLHSPAPATMAAAWAMLRESLVVTTSASRATKEAVATVVSLGNTCPYCVEVHGATLGGLGVAAGGLAAGDLEAVADDDLRAVATWVRDGGTRGSASVWRRPFPDAHTPQLVGVAVTFHYLNRMVNVFLGDSPLPPRMPAGARESAGRFLGKFMRGPALRGARPGEALALLAPAPPAGGWAAGEQRVAEAFGRAAATVDATAAVPRAVRELVVAELSTWDGRSPGLSREWVERAIAPLSTSDRAAGRLALLVAKASYQVDDWVVEAYRRTRPDAALVELVSWAAFTAAMEVGGWLGGQGSEQAAQAG